MADPKCEECGQPIEGDYEYRPWLGGFSARHIASCPIPPVSGEGER